MFVFLAIFDHLLKSNHLLMSSNFNDYVTSTIIKYTKDRDDELQKYKDWMKKEGVECCEKCDQFFNRHQQMKCNGCKKNVGCQYCEPIKTHNCNYCYAVFYRCDSCSKKIYCSICSFPHCFGCVALVLPDDGGGGGEFVCTRGNAKKIIK
jgi:hypothetical protein